MDPNCAAHDGAEPVDPRIQRTRRMLSDALEKLLLTKEFEAISVGEIAASAGVNRATFYDHYPDKYQLLQCVVGSRFNQFLTERQVCFEAVCASTMKPIVLALCDYLTAALAGPCGRERALTPQVELTVIKVIRRLVLNGLERGKPETTIPLGMIASAGSWAIYGAVREWLDVPNRPAPERVFEHIVTLVTPMFESALGPAHAGQADYSSNKA